VKGLRLRRSHHPSRTDGAITDLLAIPGYQSFTTGHLTPRLAQQEIRHLVSRYDARGPPNEHGRRKCLTLVTSYATASQLGRATRQHFLVQPYITTCQSLLELFYYLERAARPEVGNMSVVHSARQPFVSSALRRRSSHE